MPNEAHRSDMGAEAFVVRHRNPLARDYVIVSRVVLVGYPELSDGAKITYWVIYSHDWFEQARGGRKGYVYPTVGRLAGLRHTTDRTIQRHLAELIDAGLLTRELRQGKPSVLYIEEPSEGEIKRYRREQNEGGDISVGGGATFLSPQQEDKDKQIKPVNAVENNSMEKGEMDIRGWKPIKAVLDPNWLPRKRRLTSTGTESLNKDQGPKPVGRTEWIAGQIVDQTGDHESLGCYRTIAERCPRELVFEAISLLKEARQDGTIRKSRGALFVGIVRRLCRERGIPDPLGEARDPLAVRTTSKPRYCDTATSHYRDTE